MKNIKNIIISIVMTVLAVLYTYLVKTVDVASIGPNNSKVGFSSLNKLFSDLVGSNMTIYKITEIFGIIILLIVVVYACLGILQLKNKKNILKIDREILILGIFYVLMAITYIFFEKFIINYRPILIDGVLEASYPSSHTILALCTGISSMIVSRHYINKKYIKIADIITITLMLIVLVGRILSGVHWISDIIGGVIISSTLLSYFYTAYNYRKNDN